MRFKAVVTGSSGFIGGHLVSALPRYDYDVLSLGRQLLYRPHILKRYMRDHAPTHIFHLAAFGNHAYQNDEKRAIKANIETTYNLLSATRDVPYSLFVYIGSSSEYGHKLGRMREEEGTFPQTYYGATKLAATALCLAERATYNKPVLVVRPFSVYGEGEGNHRFIPTVIHALRERKIIPLVPNPAHDWVYIKDFLEALMVLVAKYAQLKHPIVNIASGKQYTNEEIVTFLGEILRREPEIEVVPQMRSYDTETWLGDISVLRDLGWSPRFSIFEGLSNTCDYYKPFPEKKNHNHFLQK